MPAVFPACVARRQRGKSLVELVVSLALGAMMLALTATSVLALALGEQSGTAAADLVSSIEQARHEAVLRRVPVGVCGIDARDAETPMSSLGCTSDAWTGGWMTFVDANNNQKMDDGELVLQVRRTRRAHVQYAQDTTSHAVSFRPIGTLAHHVPMRLFVMPANTPDPNARAVCVGIDGHVQVIAAAASCR